MKSNIYTDDDIKEIRKIISDDLESGKIRSRIFQEVQAFHPVDGRHLAESLETIKEIYNEEVEKYKGTIKIDMNAVLERSLTRYEELYNTAIETKNYKLAKVVLDSLVKLTTADKLKSMTDKANEDGTIEFHLDFGL